MVEMMIDTAESLKIDLMNTDKKGKTGFQWAKDCGHTNVVNLMKKKMRNIPF